MFRKTLFSPGEGAIALLLSTIVLNGLSFNFLTTFSASAVTPLLIWEDTGYLLVQTDLAGSGLPAILLTFKQYLDDIY